MNEEQQSIELKQLIPLFITCALLLGANGSMQTYISIRGASENFSVTVLGILSGAYFAGTLIGCIYVPNIIANVGHIRCFTGLTGFLVASILLMAIFITPITWIILRIISGICLSGLFATSESWILSSTQTHNRGKILSIYRIIDFAVVAGSQFLLSLFNVKDPKMFMCIAIIFSLSMVPIALADRSKPISINTSGFSIKMIWNTSPLACTVTIINGAAYSCFRMLGPIYIFNLSNGILQTSQNINNNKEVALFIICAILGAFIMQYPLGAISDKKGRRPIILIASIISSLTAFSLVFIDFEHKYIFYSMVFIFGAFSLPIQSIIMAFANDHITNSSNFVTVATGLIFFHFFGSILGPLLSVIATSFFGNNYFFLVISALYFLIIPFCIIRITTRQAPSQRKSMVAIIKTSPYYFKMLKDIYRNKRTEKK